jgi:hypothetical protein
MSRFKYILTITLALLTFLEMNSQDPVERIWSEIDSINQYVAAPAENVSASRWSFNTTLGTSFSYAPQFGSAMNMFVAPHADFLASRRLTFHTGVMASHIAPVAYQTNSELPLSKGLNNMSVFVAASYQLTENLIIHGTGVKSLMLYPGDIENSNFNFQDYSVGATYNFGNFSIGASIHSSQNLNFGSPIGFGNNMYGSPLYW